MSFHDHRTMGVCRLRGVSRLCVVKRSRYGVNTPQFLGVELASDPQDTKELRTLVVVHPERRQRLDLINRPLARAFPIPKHPSSQLKYVLIEAPDIVDVPIDAEPLLRSLVTCPAHLASHIVVIHEHSQCISQRSRVPWRDK